MPVRGLVLGRTEPEPRLHCSHQVLTDLRRATKRRDGGNCRIEARIVVMLQRIARFVEATAARGL